MPEIAGFEDVAPGVDQGRAGRPEDQRADGVGEATASNALAFLFKLGRGFVVGRKQDFKGAPLVIWA
jgi:hypothetical protein